MATSLTVSQATVQVGWSFTKDDDVGGKTSNGNTLSWALTTPLTNGTGANQANQLYAATVTIAGGGTNNLDLAGVLTNAFGDTVTFARIKGMSFTLNSTSSASSISVGGAGSNTFVNWVGDATDKVVVRNGYTFALLGADATGYAVTAGTGDRLLITNNDGSNAASVTILLYGASS